MTDLERLLAIEEIKQLKARYFYHLDHKDWAGWRREVFAPDATMELPQDGGQKVVGIDAIIPFVATVLEGVTTVHHGHMPIIEILPDGTAKGLWAMEDVLLWPAGHHLGFEGRYHGYGHYRETYAKGPEGWRIASLVLTRLHLGPMP
jgi:hypothetical protein